MDEVDRTPALNKAAFVCPHCQAHAQQHWATTYEKVDVPMGPVYRELKWLNRSWCNSCQNQALWLGGYMIYPPHSTAPIAPADLPEDFRVDYDEARDIAARSPRGASALLRLVVEGLVEKLGGTGDTLSKKIGSLVQAGKIDARVQKSLDSMRIMVGGQVHTGELNRADDHGTAGKHFILIHLIVYETITKDKYIDAVWKEQPEAKREGVAQRDKPKM